MNSPARNRICTLAILSDIHYASVAEQARGADYEFGAIANPLLRRLVRLFRHYVWLRRPLNRNYLLDGFLEVGGGIDYLVANGDFSCDSAFIGASDDAARQSIRECLDKLRGRFGPNFRATIGDHELGKTSLAGGQGGMRLASWRRVRNELNLAPFWQLELGPYVLIGVASSLVALPVFQPETLPEERSEWEQARREHLDEIRRAFTALEPARRVLLFCHDPTALPFLWREEAVRSKISQIEQTLVGHLHSNLVFRLGRLLAGMPVIHFLGRSVQRMTSSLHEARYWAPFHVRLCPALAGVELLKDGGYLTAELDLEEPRLARFRFHALPRG